MVDKTLHRIIQVMLISIAPAAELRVAIPFGITKGLHPLVAFTAAVVASWAVLVPMFVVLDLFYEGFLSNIALVRRFVQEVRHRGGAYVERWGVLGVGIYVSLPLPGPGIYSGAILAWLFGLPRRRAIVALALGIAASGMLVAAISTGVIAIIRRLMQSSGY